jgi:hypothetical protein
VALVCEELDTSGSVVCASCKIHELVLFMY